MQVEGYLKNVKIRSPKLKRLFVKHCKEWGKCEACPLHLNATHHVLLRGRLPADVLFIGEAPGDVEDTLGSPFVGPSGKLLSRIIVDTQAPGRGYSYAITNTVACIPRDGDSVRPPSKEEMSICQRRVVQVLFMANPKVIVYVGKAAESRDKALGFVEDEGPPRMTILHPAFLLRNGGMSPLNLHWKRTILSLKKFLETNLKEKP